MLRSKLEEDSVTASAKAQAEESYAAPTHRLLPQGQVPATEPNGWTGSTTGYWAPTKQPSLDTELELPYPHKRG